MSQSSDSNSDLELPRSKPLREDTPADSSDSDDSESIQWHDLPPVIRAGVLIAVFLFLAHWIASATAAPGVTASAEIHSSADPTEITITINPRYAQSVQISGLSPSWEFKSFDATVASNVSVLAGDQKTTVLYQTSDTTQDIKLVYRITGGQPTDITAVTITVLAPDLKTARTNVTVGW